jgi:hypothetical protein
MINRVQIGSPAVMKATEAPRFVELDEYLSMPVILKKDLNWKNDVQMYSNYLDRKVRQIISFIYENNRCKNMGWNLPIRFSRSQRVP